MHSCAEAEQGGQDVEGADDEHGHDNRFTCSNGGRNREETHQDVRHSGSTEHQSHTEGDLVKRVGQEQSWLEETLSCIGSSGTCVQLLQVNRQELDMVNDSFVAGNVVEELKRAHA